MSNATLTRERSAWSLFLIALMKGNSDSITGLVDPAEIDAERSRVHDPGPERWTTIVDPDAAAPFQVSGYSHSDDVVILVGNCVDDEHAERRLLEFLVDFGTKAPAGLPMRPVRVGDRRFAIDGDCRHVEDIEFDVDGESAADEAAKLTSFLEEFAVSCVTRETPERSPELLAT